MTNKTVLNDEEIRKIADAFFTKDDDPDEGLCFARDVEQAVLQSPEIQKLRKQAEPDMFWNHDNPECSHDSIEEVLTDINECSTLSAGDTVEIMQAVKLENIKVRITKVGRYGDFEHELVTAAMEVKP